MSTLVTRSDVEDFLFTEAALLDDWQLDEWVALLAPDVTYRVLTRDVEGKDPLRSLALCTDDAVRLRERAKQLMGSRVWVENPRPFTRRLVSNVRVRSATADEAEVTANFIISRNRKEQTDLYVGRYEHQLVRQDGRLRIRRRVSILDTDALRPQTMTGIIF